MAKKVTPHTVMDKRDLVCKRMRSDVWQRPVNSPASYSHSDSKALINALKLGPGEVSRQTRPTSPIS
jgi:hypothetical protein